MAEFTNINGVYAKDSTLRDGVSTLRDTVIGQTIKPLTITANGTYTADPTQGTYGYSPVVVDVQEQPWQPLEDGYSNFWFELTDDTLSPWLNFSAKNNDAVIDWGDGSGEVALDTLTPTHTYSKAGKYVVKVKGVTGIDVQYSTIDKYSACLQYIELDDEVVNLAQRAFMDAHALKEATMTVSPSARCFQYCAALKSIKCRSTGTLVEYIFDYCFALENFEFINTTVVGSYTFAYCRSFTKIILPNTVTGIRASAFSGCGGLREIHIQATAPPTLNSNVFNGLPTDYIIYVPVGYGETYKTAWSDYADHILEEGQEPTRAMLAKLADTGEER